jgi:ubiquinone/menaquinone biosynthesis C-methylase UbiE
MQSSYMAYADHVMWDSLLGASLGPQLAALRGCRVLDLGCGAGLLARSLQALGAEVIALDVVRSPEWQPRTQPGPRYIVGRGGRLPFRDDSFDAVITCSTLQYQDHRETFAEMIRVTRDQGRLLLHENMPHNPFVALYRQMRKLRAVFDDEVGQYTSSIRGYLSPKIVLRDLPFAELHLESCAHAYFFAPLFFPAPGSNIVRLAMDFDRTLLRTVPFLRRYSWFCSYRITVHKTARASGPPPGSIAHGLGRFAETRDLRHLFAAVVGILRQGRAAEAAYGAYCLAVHRPMAVELGSQDRDVIDTCRQLAKSAATELDEVDSALATIGGLPRGLKSRPQLIVRTPDGYVVGEYTQVGRSARLFHVAGGTTRMIDYYDKHRRVRHLHSIALVGDRKLLISTGDSAKYLDEWQLQDGRLVFQRRVMRYFAGFIAYTSAGGALYFGTDFSERPNYLLRLHDRHKFFLPHPAFRQYVETMTPYQDRYIACGCGSLYGASSVAIFDTRAERFIYCAEEPSAAARQCLPA